MFTTHPNFSFPVPKGLAPTGVQYWRIIGIPLEQPWLIATFIGDPEPEDGNEILCLGWDRDLVQRIRQSPAREIVDLMCVVPPWQASAGRWSSHSVASIWSGTLDSHEAYVFVDLDGNEFCCWGGMTPSEVRDRRLVVKIPGSIAAESRLG